MTVLTYKVMYMYTVVLEMMLVHSIIQKAWLHYNLLAEMLLQLGYNQEHNYYVWGDPTS